MKDDILFWLGITVACVLFVLSVVGKTTNEAAAQTEKPAEIHNWVNGPYYITAMVPERASSTGTSLTAVKVEHCTDCGFLRLIGEGRSLTRSLYELDDE